MGDDICFSFDLISKANQCQKLVVDYRVHHVKAKGRRSAKVFKFSVVVLDGGGSKAMKKTHKIRHITTRKYYPGLHTIEILVNGCSRGQTDFVLDL